MRKEGTALDKLRCRIAGVGDYLMDMLACCGVRGVPQVARNSQMVLLTLRLSGKADMAPCLARRLVT